MIRLRAAFYSFPGGQSASVIWLGGEAGRPRGAGWGKAELHSVAIKLVDPELGFSGVCSPSDGIINRLRALARVEGERGFQEELALDRHSSLGVLGAAFEAFHEICRKGLTVALAGDHGPLALELGFVFLRGGVVLRPGGGYGDGAQSDQPKVANGYHGMWL